MLLAGCEEMPLGALLFVAAEASSVALVLPLPLSM